MYTSPDSAKTIHQGRNVRRFREILGLKQEALAIVLGQDWTQKRVSLLESRETLDEDTLKLVASALRVPEDAIRYMDEEAAIQIISSTFNDHAVAVNYKCEIKPIDRGIELLEEIKSLHTENKALYERLLEKETQLLELLKNK